MTEIVADYRKVHSERVNLLIHLFAVPLFDLSFVATGAALAAGRYFVAGTAALAAVSAMLLQGLGHRREAQAPAPFAGPADFLRRWFREQFVTFPRFLASGEWAAQWRRARRD